MAVDFNLFLCFSICYALLRLGRSVRFFFFPNLLRFRWVGLLWVRFLLLLSVTDLTVALSSVDTVEGRLEREDLSWPAVVRRSCCCCGARWGPALMVFLRRCCSWVSLLELGRPREGRTVAEREDRLLVFVREREAGSGAAKRGWLG
ncbi:hypothetical protein Peur_030158 [Populus x canadensis]